MVLSPIYVSHKLKKKQLENVLSSRLIKLNLIFLTFIIKEWEHQRKIKKENYSIYLMKKYLRKNFNFIKLHIFKIYFGRIKEQWRKIKRLVKLF